MKNENKFLLPLWIIVIFLLFVTLYIGKDFIVMLVFTTMLLLIFSWIYNCFYKIYKSQFISFLSTWWLFLLIFMSIWSIVVSQIDTFADDIGKIQTGLTTFLESNSFIQSYVAEFDIMSLLSKINFTAIWVSTLSLVSWVIGWLFTVGILLVFLMLEKDMLQRKIRSILNDSSKDVFQKISKKIFHDLNVFFVSKFWLALFNGAISAIIMLVFWLEYALVFALLVFLLDFIPAIWGIIALTLPFLYSFTDFESSIISFFLLGCLMVPQFISGNIIEPKIMGNRLNLSPLVILVSLIFWSSLWWVAGAFLAIPIMASLNIVFTQFEKTRWITILFSKDGSV